MPLSLGVEPQGDEQPKAHWQKKREDIHAIYTADQSAEIPPPENTNTPHVLDTPKLYFHSLYIITSPKTAASSLD